MMNGGEGWRMTTTAATAIVLMTPAANTGRVPKRPPINFSWISPGAPGVGLTSQRIAAQRGML